ncbi:MAG: MBL fold metallo-hydrolase [Oscillospiraceae bacterium]|nr:MBL fold metallo-hydrolase [Oscillospiraceae bacterium]
MLIKTLTVGMMANNCYIVTDEKTLQCAIIDPGAESSTILDYIEANKLKPEVIFITHGHFDHSMALDAVLDAFNVPVYINQAEVNRGGQRERHLIEEYENMRYCKDGDIISVGSLQFIILDTPGHSPGSITIMCENALFTGDTLFNGDCGRTDLEGGNRETILKSLNRLAELDGDYEVYPGHEESTTLDAQRAHNLDMRIATGELT